MKLISNKSIYLAALFLWSFQLSAQIPESEQYQYNSLITPQDLTIENREQIQNVERARAEIAARDRLVIALLDGPTQELYIRSNVNRCLQAQLPEAFCNLLMQPPWNQP